MKEGSKSSNFTFNNPFKPLTMKYKFLLIAFSAALLTGCSTAYQAGQTPDDVYYSPAKESVARAEKRHEERKPDRYQEYLASEDDNYLRRKIQNRSRWSTIDDFDYWYDPTYSSYYNYRSYRYNPYMANNWHYSYTRPIWDRYNYNGWYGSYNPFFAPAFYGGGYYGRPVYVVKNPLMPSTNVSRPALGSYNNKTYSNGNYRSSFGDMIKRAVTPSNSGYSNSNSGGYSNNNTSSSSPSRSTYEAPTRTYNPPPASSSSSSSSSSGSGSSNGAGSTRPPR